jgi:hypothetical protein
MLYLIVLTVHSWLRWLVLGAGIVAFARGVAARGGTWTRADDRAGFWFTMALDLQALLGLLLYAVLSPITREAFRDISAAMRSSGLRFWAVEHIFGMLVALVFVHVGRVRIRRAEPARRGKLTLIFFGLALVAVLASVPWPGTPAARPLLRW